MSHILSCILLLLILQNLLIFFFSIQTNTVDPELAARSIQELEKEAGCFKRRYQESERAVTYYETNFKDTLVLMNNYRQKFEDLSKKKKKKKKTLILYHKLMPSPPTISY